MSKHVIEVRNREEGDWLFSAFNRPTITTLKEAKRRLKVAREMALSTVEYRLRPLKKATRYYVACRWLNRTENLDPWEASGCNVPGGFRSKKAASKALSEWEGKGSLLAYRIQTRKPKS
jgi:hypothetical protein